MLVLCVGVLIGIASQQRVIVYADVMQQYALDISTGSSGIKASLVDVIMLDYTAEDGTDSCYAIFPSEAMKETMETAVNNLSSEDRSLQELGTRYFNENATLLDDMKDEFSLYSTQTLLFRPFKPIKTLNSVTIITNDVVSWDISGMRLVKLDGGKVSWIPASAVASSGQVSYSGTRIAELGESITVQSTSTAVVQFGGFEQCNDTYVSYDSGRDDFVIKLDIADEYLAGLESNACELSDGKTISSYQPADMLYLTVNYEDIFGQKKLVKLPVLSSMLAELMLAGEGSNGNNYANLRTYGLAQQGDSLVVKCRLPGFQRLITDSKVADHGIDIEMGLKNAKSGYHLDITGSRALERDQIAKKEKETIAFTGISVYAAGNISYKHELQNYEGSTDAASGRMNGRICTNIEVKDTDALRYYYAYKKHSGRSVSYGMKEKFALKENTTGLQKIESPEWDTSNLYLVEINTADIPKAATVNDLMLSLTYQTYGSDTEQVTSESGKTKTTVQYSIRDLVTEFYGYWPAKGDDPTHFAYLRGVDQGGTLRFVVPLTKVDKFVSATVALEDGAKDEWQMTSMTIYQVTDVKARSVYFLSAGETDTGDAYLHCGESMTDRVFEREIITGEEYFARSMEELLIRKGHEVTIPFTESKSIVDEPMPQKDWDPNSDEMNYEKACTDLGFGTSIARYDVSVNVAAANEGDSVNGDSGSKNMFYFRLNFENGSSGYVLANQQLSGDGFRTGMTERFTIALNQDFGELASVDIIPDDSASSSDIYDKLKISEIRVARVSNNSLSQSWVISNPGWVGIDYVEEDLRSDEKRYEGRTEGEIANHYTVDRTSYNVKLLFAVSTGAYPEGERPFSGSVYATLNYNNNAGEIQTMSFDLVEYMQRYQEGDTLAVQSNVTGKTQRVKADADRMFRANTIDRFFLDVPDVKSLNYIRLEISDPDGCTLKINSIGVSLVSNVGQMILNSNNEFVYAGDYEDLTVSNAEAGYTIVSSAASTPTVTIGFEENEIKTDMGEESGKTPSATVSRVPGGKNDELNIYIYPTAESRENIGSYSIAGEYTYVNCYGRQYVNKINELNSNEECYYKTGISSPNLSQVKTLTSKGAKVAGSAGGSLRGDYIVIQRVRAGVLLNTTVSNNYNFDLTGTETYESAQSTTNNETQQVNLYFGEGTERQQLEEEKKNVAVSIGFRTALGDNDTVYHSPFIFLTDQEYEQIYQGMMATIDFHIPFVKEITDIQIAGIGNLEAFIHSASVATYTGDQSQALSRLELGTTYDERYEEAVRKRVCNSWYTFDIRNKLEEGTTTYRHFIKGTDESGILTPVTLELSCDSDGNTAGAVSTGENNTSGTDMGMELSLIYLNSLPGKQESMIYVSDIRNWIGKDSSFSKGGTLKLHLMVEDLEAVKGISLRTIGDGAVYPLASVKVIWNHYGTEETISRNNIDQQIGNSVPTWISLVSATMKIEASSRPAEGIGITMDSEKGDSMNFALNQKDQLEGIVTYSSSYAKDSIEYQLRQITDSGAESAVANVDSAVKVTTEIRDVLRMNFKVDTSELAGGRYVLTFIGKETDKRVAVEFIVTVPVTEQISKEAGGSDDRDSLEHAGGSEEAGNSEGANSSEGSNSSEGAESSGDANKSDDAGMAAQETDDKKNEEQTLDERATENMDQSADKEE